MGCYDF
jgi:hypothetical protein